MQLAVSPNHKSYSLSIRQIVRQYFMPAPKYAGLNNDVKYV